MAKRVQTWLTRVSLWVLPVLVLSFLFTGVAATWHGPNSHSFVALVINGFLLVSLLVVLSALPAPQSTREPEEGTDA